MSDEAPPAAASEDEEPAPRTGPKGVVLIGALVGGLVIGVAAGLFAVGPIVAKKSGYELTAAADSGHATESGDEAGGASGDHGAEGEGGETASAVHLIDNLVLNPAGSGGTRFVMLAAAVEFVDAKYVDALKARDAEARDLVLRVVGSRGVEQLAEMAFRDVLRKELADSLAALFPKAERASAIKRIFFPQFVIQ